MKPFLKRKESIAEPKPNVLSKGMQAGYKHLQGGWANWMMKRTKKFSRRTWLVLLILFVLSTSAYSVYLAVSAFTKKEINSLTITPIKKPKYSTETGERPIEAAEVSEAEYNRIKKFRVYMDSLARSPSGKTVYDSITSHRPGLMDSVRFIENYYQKLKQK
jgi:flagellar basal body-associated protein FliL